MKACNEEITYFETVMCFKHPLSDRTVRDIANYLSCKVNLPRLGFFYPLTGSRPGGAELESQELGARREKELSPIVFFLHKSSLHHVPVFLSDPDILETLDSLPEGTERSIEELFGNRRIVSFGVLEDQWSVKQKDILFEELQTAGFHIHSGIQQLDFQIKNRTTDHVTTHYLLLKNSVFIHIVVFYKRVPGFYWHGSVVASKLPRDLTEVSELKPWKREGAFDRITVEQLQHVSDQILVPVPIRNFLDQVEHSTFTPCNDTGAREFFNTHGKDESAEGRKFTRKARQTIARAKTYLDELGIPFWLSSGTCLGWFRQCDIITYSQDVDFGIWIKDYKPDLVPVFERGGFLLTHVFGKVSDSYELSFQAGDIKLDLFFFYEESDCMWNGGTHYLNGQKYKYIFPKFSLSWTVFLDLKVRVPYPALPYIEANYGVKWSEPVKNWEWNRSPPNVRENGFWPKEEWDTVIQII